MRKTGLLVPVLALMLAACGQAQTGAPLTGSATQISPPVAEQPTTMPEPTMMAEPTVAPPAEQPTTGSNPDQSVTGVPATGSTSQGSDVAVAQARHQLARHLGIGEDKLSLQSANAQQWPNGALGCPEAGVAYNEMVIPGFLLKFSGAGQSYEVHTDSQGTQLVLCENGKPTDISADATGSSGGPLQPAAPAADPASQPLVELAQQALAKDLGVSQADVKLVTAEPAEWNDSSLGCPKPGMTYLQVISPGYRIVLEAQGQQHEYHTDQQKTVVRCDTP